MHFRPHVRNKHHRALSCHCFVAIGNQEKKIDGETSPIWQPVFSSYATSCNVLYLWCELCSQSEINIPSNIS